tara:strand:+ start:942 stop:1205 length:264 start_codon:yes stop_codon:yes gene_type:complete
MPIPALIDRCSVRGVEASTEKELELALATPLGVRGDAAAAAMAAAGAAAAASIVSYETTCAATESSRRKDDLVLRGDDERDRISPRS